MKLKLKRNYDGSLTGKTARKYNFKNEKALGRKAVESMVEAGAAPILQRNNFHAKLGGTSKEPKFRRKFTAKAALQDELWYEEDLIAEEAAELRKEQSAAKLERERPPRHTCARPRCLIAR